MEIIINANDLTFKDIEKKFFEYFCQKAREATAVFLKEYDKYLRETRDTKAYRHKGYKQTTVKTVYGEVEYKRSIYETYDEDGQKQFVYLLDETLGLKTVGLISRNYAEQLVKGITTKSYRDCAKEVSETTGQTISPMGVWNVVQELGNEICKEERELVRCHKKDRLQGTREAQVLFEETDGVNLKLQGADRKTHSKGKAEMKVAIAYDGWKKVAENRYLLDGKVAFAGFEKAKQFHKIREAKIAAEYDIDETKIRILNGDGAQWIKKVPDKDTVFQLDPFHRNKAVKEKIHNEAARSDIMEFINAADIDGLFKYLDTYINSLTEDNEIEDAKCLMGYFSANAGGLLPYQKRIELPESPAGIEYRNMGTMENHIWSIIAKRMKHNHTTWSIRGANHLAKLLAKKCEGKLNEVTDRLRKPAFEEEKTEELLGKVLSAAKSTKPVGKGYEYPVSGSLTWLKNDIRGGHVAFDIAGY